MEEDFLDDVLCEEGFASEPREMEGAQLRGPARQEVDDALHYFGSHPTVLEVLVAVRTPKIARFGRKQDQLQNPVVYATEDVSIRGMRVHGSSAYGRSDAGLRTAFGDDHAVVVGISQRDIDVLSCADIVLDLRREPRVADDDAAFGIKI